MHIHNFNKPGNITCNEIVMRSLVRPLLLLFFTIGYLPSFCQVIDASICDTTSRFPITQYSFFLRTTEPITIDSVIKSPSGFIKAKNEPVLVFEYDPYYYWLRIVVKNQQDKSRQLMLLMAPVGMYDGRLFQKIGGHWNQVAQAGLKYKFKDRSYQFTHHVFPFTLAPKSIDTLYVSIDASNVYKLFGFALIQPKELKIFENNIYFVFGIIVGLLLLFFVLNISLFFALKEKLYLWYALYIVLLFLVVMKNDQLDQQFLGLDSEKAFRLTPFLAIGALAIAVLMHVVQSFFKNVLIHNKLLYRFSIILKVNILCIAVIHAFVFLTVFDYRIQSIVFGWAKISILLGICIIIVNCIYCIRKGFKSALFIFCGSLVFMIGSVQRLFFPSTLSFLFPPTTFHIGIILETFVISMGLIFRYWLEKEQNRQRENNYMQEIHKAQLEIQEQTHKKNSQEKHDNIGQVLSLVKLNINTMDCDEPKALQGKINDSRHLITKAIQDLRDLSKSLDTDYVTDMGLIRSVEYELEMIKKTGVYKIQFEIKGEPYRLKHQQELIFFRIVQEALHNIIKHAKATAIAVQLMFEPEMFTLQITDNGIGFDTSQLEQNNFNGLGLGIRNMHNRATMINADFKLISALEKGTTITLTLLLQTSKL